MNYNQLTMSAPVSAFLLAGGASRRMGTDKAFLLVASGQTLLARQLALLTALTADVAVLAPPNKYTKLKVPVYADLRPDSGPLAAIETALVQAQSPWSLILAVDHAEVTCNWLAKLVARALASPSACITSATTPDSLSPLCAVWHKAALPAVQAALNSGNFRVRDVVTALPHEFLIPENPQILSNWNRPEDIRPLDTIE